MPDTPRGNPDVLVPRPATPQERERALIDAALKQASPVQASPSSGTSATLDLPPDTFPGYELIREIHRGGQGVVYLALQKATNRKVAIKVVREGPFAGTAERARFEREVHILGQLNHPNIVAIHDSGAAAGSFFYVMDYVSGRPLDEWISHAGDSRVDDTLRLFLSICDAVSAAHLRGIVHRDLKPSNIRIDANGAPHVLDFGLAKVSMLDGPLSESGADGPTSQPRIMTMTGQFVGSLPWASPEQAEGAPDKVDIRSDVYSLGVILYQMLTGRFPYQVIGNMRDVLDNILKAEPARPSTVRRQINNEVETIVLKCLSKERDRRYQSAGELARDIRHYLDGEPIEAKRDSGWYVITKTLRRYKAAVAIVAGFVVLLAFFAVFMTVMYQDKAHAELQEREQRRAAENNLGEANRAKAAAVAAEQATRENADALRAVVRTLLTDFNREIRYLRGATRARVLLRETALKALADLEARAGPDADAGLLRDLADAHEQVGDIQIGLAESFVGTAAEAMKNYTRAMEIRASLLEKHPDAAWARAAVARSHLRQGGALVGQRRYDDARAELQRAVDRFDGAIALAPAGARDADDYRDQRREALVRIADAQRAQGEALLASGDPAGAKRLLDDVFETYDRAAEYWSARANADSSDRTPARELAVVHDKKATALRRIGGLLARQALSRAAEGAPDAALIAQALERFEASRDLCERAAGSFRVLADAAPHNTLFMSDAAMALHLAGWAELDAATFIADLGARGARPDAAAESRARHEHAMSLFQRALDIGQRLADSDEADLHSQRELALYLNKIGNQHLTLGRPDEARDAYARSVAVRRALFASDPTPRHRRDLMQGLYKLGDVHRERALAGPPENREPELRAGLAFLEEARDLLTAPDARPIPTRTPDLTEVMNVLNKCRAALGMPEEAFPLLERP